jgi:trehalose/maltose hydrolase-like predicted phosphorylase
MTWVLVLDSDRLLERVQESLLTIGDGRFGTRGAQEEGGATSSPMVLAAGVYQIDGKVERLLDGPRWAELDVSAPPPVSDRWFLDLRRGVLEREVRFEDEVIRTVRFASLTRQGLMVLRAEGPSGWLDEGDPLRAPRGAVGLQRGELGDQSWMSVTSALGGGITAIATQHVDGSPGQQRSVERLAVYRADPAEVPSPSAAVSALGSAHEAGFDVLLREHAAAWQRRWDRADIEIAGDPDLQLAVRFGLFHLMSAVDDGVESAVGARGLSGPAYAGHVFWDADVYVLPVLAAVRPAAARAMLTYRARRLKQARARAVELGCAGARFPWESATTGEEVAPTEVHHPDGNIDRIWTGQIEHHISADVAWAVDHYVDWTGDEGFLVGDGRRILRETARFWASRIECEAGAHIRGVIGPDEYHEFVDDDVFTNAMARWNLRRAAALERRLGGDAVEAERWERLAADLVEGYDTETGLHEQFSGFFDLEPLVITELTPTPVAADLLLGRERVQGAQVVKQPDVLMAHHLVPGELRSGTLREDLDFYLPRTAHGSSLSPAICAALLARCGRPDEALPLLRTGAAIDLEDLTGTTAGGLHIAAMGGVWQAIVHGFAGIRPGTEALSVDPHLPSSWDRIRLRLHYRNVPCSFTLAHDTIEVSVEAGFDIILPGGRRASLAPGSNRFENRGGSWQRRQDR